MLVPGTYLWVQSWALCSALSMYHLGPLGLVPLISSILPLMKLRLRVRQFAEGFCRGRVQICSPSQGHRFSWVCKFCPCPGTTDRLRGIRQKAVHLIWAWGKECKDCLPSSHLISSLKVHREGVQRATIQFREQPHHSGDVSSSKDFSEALICPELSGRRASEVEKLVRICDHLL